MAYPECDFETGKKKKEIQIKYSSVLKSPAYTQKLFKITMSVIAPLELKEVRIPSETYFFDEAEHVAHITEYSKNLKPREVLLR